METGVCKICGSPKTSMTMIGGSKFKWCHACGETSLIQTNADRIRAMSDEELADELIEWIAYGGLFTLSDLKAWLKQEVKNEKTNL